MLELRPNCECCNKDLPPDATDARICSFECTFCADCAEQVLRGICPNCGGKLRKVFSAVGVTFNGSGFYRTDSRGKSDSSTSSST